MSIYRRQVRINKVKCHQYICTHYNTHGFLDYCVELTVLHNYKPRRIHLSGKVHYLIHIS